MKPLTTFCSISTHFFASWMNYYILFHQGHNSRVSTNHSTLSFSTLPKDDRNLWAVHHHTVFRASTYPTCGHLFCQTNPTSYPKNLRPFSRAAGRWDFLHLCVLCVLGAATLPRVHPSWPCSHSLEKWIWPGINNRPTDRKTVRHTSRVGITFGRKKVQNGACRERLLVAVARNNS